MLMWLGVTFGSIYLFVVGKSENRPHYFLVASVAIGCCGYFTLLFARRRAGKVQNAPKKPSPISTAPPVVAATALSGGPQVTRSPSTPSTGPNAEAIRSTLKQFKKRKKVLCLECGYDGLMGVLRSARPVVATIFYWTVMIGLGGFFSLFSVVNIVMAVLGVLFLAALGALFLAATEKHYVQCPQCNRTLGPC